MSKHCTMRLRNFKTESIEMMEKKYLKLFDAYTSNLPWLDWSYEHKMARRNLIRAIVAILSS